MINHKIQTIDVHELKKLYDTSPDLCLIDVREDHEWKEFHIPKAIHIPKDTLVSVIEDTIPNKETPIYLHCKGGVRSLYSANCLAELGYQDVYSVDGGIVEWAISGYPVKSS